MLGHKWKYVENGIPNEIDLRCTRCNKSVIKVFSWENDKWTIR